MNKTFIFQFSFSILVHRYQTAGCIRGTWDHDDEKEPSNVLDMIEVRLQYSYLNLNWS